MTQTQTRELSADVVKRLQAELDNATAARDELTSKPWQPTEIRTNSDRLEALTRQIAGLQRQIPEANTNGVAKVADAIKAFVLGNPEAKSYFASGGKTIYVRADNGTVSVDTLTRTFAPRAKGETRAQREAVLIGPRGEEYKNYKPLGISPKRGDETNSAYQKRMESLGFQFPKPFGS